MAEPYLGEIRIFGFSFAPRGWAYCEGQLVSIAQNTALYSVLGTTFGGDGQTTFGLPNMKGNAPMEWGNGPNLTPRTIGEMFGEPSVTLTVLQLPGHNHILYGATPGDPATQSVAQPNSTSQLSGANPGQLYTTTATPPVAFSPKAIGPAGQSQPHDNLQPMLVLNFCMAMEGLFPSRN
jgi:microcystin-dependent protein